MQVIRLRQVVVTLQHTSELTWSRNACVFMDELEASDQVLPVPSIRL